MLRGMLQDATPNWSHRTSKRIICLCSGVCSGAHRSTNNKASELMISDWAVRVAFELMMLAKTFRVCSGVCPLPLSVHMHIMTRRWGMLRGVLSFYIYAYHCKHASVGFHPLHFAAATLLAFCDMWQQVLRFNVSTYASGYALSLHICT